MKVYIVRHGEVPSNILERYNIKDEDLTDKGISQAEELREKIRDINYDIIISSPLLRAVHTAQIINAHDKEITINENIREREHGDLEGKSFLETNREEYWNYYSKITYGTAENLQMFFERVADFLDDLKTKNYDSVLVVAHSGVSKAFSAYFDGIADGLFLNRGIKNCEIKEYKL